MEAPAAPLEILTGFESTYQPVHDVDVAETSQHVARWRADLDLVRACGVTGLRYPIRWHRVEAEPATFDWVHTDAVLGYMADTGLRPIVDLLHHTSYPRWLNDGFADRRFPNAYLRYVEAFALRYPWVDRYTLFNEPFSTLFLSGHEGVWPPHRRGLSGFVALAANVLPAVAAASRACRDLLPGAQHVYVDTCERATGAGRHGRQVAAAANDRRFLLLDLFLGRAVAPDRPFVAQVVAAGGGRLFELAAEPGSVDVLGLDYYAHNQWHYGDDRAVRPSPVPAPLAELIAEYWDRYRLPCALTETNIRGFAPDRATWLKYTLEHCERARAAGVPVVGYCWFPFVDSCDWDSLLARADAHIDPVGVYWLDDRFDRRESSMATAFRQAAAGTPAAELPAYRLEEPVRSWFRGWQPQTEGWDWISPPALEVRAPTPPPPPVRSRWRTRRPAR